MNPTESRLLHATLQGDDASRDVYADWLEDAGEVDRAQFLRLQRELRVIAIDDPRYDWVLRRLHQHRVKSDPAWLAIVDDNPVYPFEVELAAHLAAREAEAAAARAAMEADPLPLPTPVAPRRAPPPRRERPTFDGWTTVPPAVHVDTRPPRWMAIGSTVAFVIIGLAFVLQYVG